MNVARMPCISCPTGVSSTDSVRAWRPRTRDLSTELPALLAARLGPIARVTYLPNAWDPSARYVNIDGTLVRLGRHRRQDPDTVDVATSSGHHLTLIVVPVPVGTCTDTAHRHRATWIPSRRGGTEQVEELLGPATAEVTALPPHQVAPTGT